MSKRYVPFVMGVAAGGASLGLISAGTWWSFALATVTTAYAIFSIKTALTATDRQIEALTGDRPLADYDVSESTIPDVRQRKVRQPPAAEVVPKHPDISRGASSNPAKSEVSTARSPSDLCPSCLEFFEADEQSCRYCGADLRPAARATTPGARAASRHS